MIGHQRVFAAALALSENVLIHGFSVAKSESGSWVTELKVRNCAFRARVG
jgi:hypothetical protein